MNLSRATKDIGAPVLTGSSLIIIDFGKMLRGSLITILCSYWFAVSFINKAYSIIIGLYCYAFLVAEVLVKFDCYKTAWVLVLMLISSSESPLSEFSL